MKLKFVTTTLLAGWVGLPFSAGADTSYQGLLSRYEKQIQQQSRQLKSLRARLVENEREATRLQRKAESARQQWSQLSKEADQARNRADATRDEWVKTRNLAESVEWEVVTQTLLSNAAMDQLRQSVKDLYAKRLMGTTPAVTPEERRREWVTEGLIDVASDASREAEKAGRAQVRLRSDELRLKSQEQERRDQWVRLREERQDSWQKWQDALRRRSALQEEKIQMEQSEQALYVMLKNLREDKNRTLASRQTSSSGTDRALDSLKGSLPWPVTGRIVQSFGRQHSSELQQLVVSNGIRMESSAGKTVRAIQPGKVIFADEFRSYGRMVIVQHAKSLASVYAGLGETRVKEGDTVSTLDALGAVGDSGSFYFELRRDERPLNPLVYLAPAQDITSRRTYP